MGYQQITRFSDLVNKSRVYDEDNRDSVAYYKALHDKKGKGKFRGKPCVTPAGKRNQKSSDDKKPSGGGASTLVRC